jgi:hypothetical protein
MYLILSSSLHVGLQNSVFSLGFATSAQVETQMWDQPVQFIPCASIHLPVYIEYYVISALCFGFKIMSEFLSISVPKCIILCDVKFLGY